MFGEWGMVNYTVFTFMKQKAEKVLEILEIKIKTKIRIGELRTLLRKFAQKRIENFFCIS